MNDIEYESLLSFADFDYIDAMFIDEKREIKIKNKLIKRMDELIKCRTKLIKCMDELIIIKGKEIDKLKKDYDELKDALRILKQNNIVDDKLLEELNINIDF